MLKEGIGGIRWPNKSPSTSPTRPPSIQAFGTLLTLFYIETLFFKSSLSQNQINAVGFEQSTAGGMTRNLNRH